MLNSWLTELKQYSSYDLKLFLIGNKSDLNSVRQVSTEEAINFMNKNNIDHFEETSAKEGINIEEIFKKAINILYSGYLKFLETNPSSNYCETNSIYNTCNSKKSITLKSDVNKVNEFKETDLIEKNKFCYC